MGSNGHPAMKRWCMPVLAVLFLPCALFGQAPDGKKLDAIVADALKAFEAPGVAVVVVHEDKVVYLKGDGVRELDKADAVTPDTVFQIASCTKAFLAMLIAMLTGDGRMDWDDPVRKHVPFFRLSDPLADQNITIRDLLCHRTGLSRHDLLWFKSPLEPAHVLRRSARDVGQWLRLQLGEGTYAGKRLVPDKHFRETHAPQMVVKLTDTLRAE